MSAAKPEGIVEDTHGNAHMGLPQHIAYQFATGYPTVRPASASGDKARILHLVGLPVILTGVPWCCLVFIGAA